MITWFGMDCNIFTNPKVLRFAGAAGLDVDAAVGKLGRLYGWAAQSSSESGDISHLPPGELAAIMRWKKKPQLLVEALVETGLLDQGPAGALRIHHWEELNGSFMRKKRQDRERKRAGASMEFPRPPYPTVPDLTLPDLRKGEGEGEAVRYTEAAR